MSHIAERIIGTFSEDEKVQRPILQEWLQAQLRSQFQAALARFCAEQPEPLSAAHVQLEELNANGLICRLPCALLDHESPHPFHSAVRIQLNPLSRTVLRLD